MSPASSGRASWRRSPSSQDLGDGGSGRPAQPAYAPSPPDRRRRSTCSGAAGSGSPEATFTAALVGLALGIVAGIVLGVLGALVPLVAELLEPVMTLLNAVPRVILAPLFVIWLGIGIASKVALAFILVAVLIFFTVFTGIRQVDRKLVERVITLGGGRWALVRHVYLPSVAAWVLGNLKVAVGFAFTGACVGECRREPRPRLSLCLFWQSTFNSALMLAIILLIMMVVLVISPRRIGWKISAAVELRRPMRARTGPWEAPRR
jgi:NitT/TauT family transport system permease protein